MPTNPYAAYNQPAPNGPYNPHTDYEVGRTQLLYPLDDPDKAFNNVLQDRGYNVYAANPFTQSLQRASRGLRQSYIQGRAQDPNTPYGQGAANTGEDYRNYLTQQLSGGRLYETLNTAAMQMPSAVQAVRNYQNQLASGQVTADTANPYLRLLADELAANGGAGTANALTYLRAPAMGTQLGRSYSNLLNNIVEQSSRTLANDPYAAQPGSNRDIWSYIFGSAGSPF